MKFTKLKEKKIRKKILKLTDNTNVSREISHKKITSIAILTTDELNSQYHIQSEIETILGIKTSKIYRFRKFKKSDEVSSEHFSEKDINWKAEFHHPKFKSFLDEPFDLLITYYNNSHLYLELATLQSKATFKVGFANVNSKLFDIEFSEELTNVKRFLTELKKYLKILNKL